MYQLNRASEAMKLGVYNYRNHENILLPLILGLRVNQGYYFYHFHYWNHYLFLYAGSLKVFFLFVINHLVGFAFVLKKYSVGGYRLEIGWFPFLF